LKKITLSMYEQTQAIEQELQAQGWMITLSGCNHGITITACKETQLITLYNCTYVGAWQALAEEVRKQGQETGAANSSEVHG